MCEEFRALTAQSTARAGTCSHDSTTKFGLTYGYSSAGSNNGQISGITDSIDSGRNVAYTYDGLARLSTAATAGSATYPAWGLKQSYDRYGNRLSQSAISGCVAPITRPQPSVSVNLATNRITTSGYSYDANGNLTNDGFNTLVYDAENRAVSASNTGSSGTYTYDGNGLRVKRVSGGTTTVYVFSGSKVIAEYDGEEGVQKEYVYSGGQLLASVGGTAISNGGFEQGLSGWSPWSCAQLVTNSANAHSGNNSVQLSSSGGAQCAIVGPTIAVNPGDQITLGGWVNLQSGNGYVGWNISVFDINHIGITSPAASPNPTGSGWTYQTGTFTIPSNGAYVYLYAQIYLPTVSTVVFVDDGFISAGTKYYHQDHLSNRMVTSSSGAVVEQMGHFPFGESWYNASNEKLLFASYERDFESSNDYAQARFFINRLGNFSSPDLLDGGMPDPQSFNHYTYVRNKPISVADPTGLFIKSYCDDEDFFCGFFQGSNPTSGGSDGPIAGGTASKTKCIFKITVKNRAKLPADQLAAAENQIASLLDPAVGVNFVTSGDSDYTLNVVNANPNNVNLGQQTGFGPFQGTPAVYPNNISKHFSGQLVPVIDRIIGTVGTHELVHRITHIGDIPLDPNNPGDLMSVDALMAADVRNNTDNANAFFIQNQFQLSPDEVSKLLKDCLKKHPQ